jgi:hypothetical protein
MIPESEYKATPGVGVCADRRQKSAYGAAQAPA